MEKAYDAIFKGDESAEMLKQKEDYRHADLSRAITIVKDYVEVANNYPFTVLQYARSKWDLMQAEKKAGVNILVWSTLSKQKDRPWVTLDFDWKQLNTTVACVVAWFLIEANNVVFDSKHYPKTII